MIMKQDSHMELYKILILEEIKLNLTKELKLDFTRSKLLMFFFLYSEVRITPRPHV